MNKFFYPLLLLVFFSCNRKGGKVISSDPPALTTEIATENDSPANASEFPEEVPPFIVVTLAKTECYGSCPSFTIHLFSNGHLTYLGKKNVSRLGYYEAWVDKEILGKIKSEAQNINYFQLANAYPKEGKILEDIPNTITTLNFDGIQKTIVNNYDSPLALRNFENYLEELLMNLEWRKMDGNL